MIEKIALAIDQPFEVRPIETEIGTGIMIPTFFSKQEITKKTISYVPDYEKTNIEFAHLITETILKKAKELGEITRIELEPEPADREEIIDGKIRLKRYYRLMIYGNRIKEEKEIEVPEHYGEVK